MDAGAYIRLAVKTGKEIQALWKDFWNIAVGPGTRKIEVYPLGESLFAECGSEIGYSNGVPDGNIDGKLEVSPLGEY